jgi:hypothetical protein
MHAAQIDAERDIIMPKAIPKLVRIVIQLPEDLKDQLDCLKQQGYTTSGFIRAMLERELQKPEFQPANGNGKPVAQRRS